MLVLCEDSWVPVLLVFSHEPLDLLEVGISRVRGRERASPLLFADLTGVCAPLFDLNSNYCRFVACTTGKAFDTLGTHYWQSL